MIKKLIIGVVSLAVLVGAYFGITYIMDKTEPEPETPAPVEITNIFKYEANAITSIELDITREDESKENYIFTKQGDDWKIAGYEHVDVYGSMIGSIAGNLYNLNAKTVVESPDALNVYGLDKPQCVVKINGKEALLIGKYEPVSAGYFAKTPNSDSVYTIHSYVGDNFFSNIDNYRDVGKYLIQNSIDIGGIKIKRDDTTIDMFMLTEEEEFKLEDSKYFLLATWAMREPMRKAMNGDLIQRDIVEVVGGIYPQTFVADNPDSYAEWGLENPKYEITFTFLPNQETGYVAEPLTIQLGNVDQGLIYAKLPNDPVVYTLDVKLFNWRDMRPTDYMSTLIFLRNIKDVEEIDFAGEIDYNLKSVFIEEEKYDYFINDKQVDEKLYRQAYQELIAIALFEEVGDDFEKAEPEITFTFKYFDGSEPELVELQPYHDRYYAVTINGKTEFIIKKAHIQSMYEKIEAAYASNPGDSD